MPSDPNIRINISPSKELASWADSAMFRSEAMPVGASGRVTPAVTLLNATPDPLGSLAALQGIYTGRVVRSLSAVSDDDRRTAYAEVTKNKLQGPLEVVQFHFLVEGVTRSFTHQMVRERQAFFAQESMRFAVVDGEAWQDRVARPPGYDSWTPLQRDDWDDAILNAENGYERLIESGIPAEDARGLMPHAMTTRLHWVTDLRGLLYVAGLRLCTQAQFEWRLVMAQVVKALRAYSTTSEHNVAGPGYQTLFDDWQFNLIADSLKPICYQEGKCGFKAKMDRPCTIRERVDANERIGRPSEEWALPFIAGGELGHGGMPEMSGGVVEVAAIHPYEWAADPSAARQPKEA
jgi:flavin-dependent thymidylate synthase